MNVLIVDDEMGLRHTLSLILEGEGHQARAAADGEEALARLAERDADIILCDVRMPVLGGNEFLERYRRMGGRGLVIMMSAYGDDDDALEAIRRGAYDFIPKPFRADQVLLVIRKAVERERLREQVRRLSAELEALRAPEGVIGRSPVVTQALALARKAAPHPSPVLITGESGTGKELFARVIHGASARAQGPFVSATVSAVPEDLLEAALFGHARHALPGAPDARPGQFEDADGGTLFIDEVAALPPALQARVFRAMQDGQVRRVGETTERSVDVRVIAASERDLDAEVAAGRFRDDLYYRLNVVRLRLPALRERREDIAELARHFLQRINLRLGLGVEHISASAMKALMDYAWPGNVRELENAVERAVVLAEGPTIQPEHLPDAIRDPAAEAPGGAAELDLSVKRRVEQLERDLIARALEQTGGNRTRAARLLELSHRALLYKIREYGLS